TPAIAPTSQLTPNYLRFRLNPDHSIALGTMVLPPGEHPEGKPVELLLSHHPESDEMEAYERLLGEAMKGDATLFAREDYVEAAWRIVGPVLGESTPVHIYEPKTWGPREAERLLDDGHSWHNPVLSR
ncbi:glucose-6-phosphate dehydrogenase, partial [Singulisphaera rosea]